MSFSFGSTGGNGAASQPTSNTAQNAGAGLFGGTTSSSSPFGQASTATAKPSTGLFGGGAASGTNVFGASTTSGTAKPASIFGSNVNSGTTPSLFSGGAPSFGAKPNPGTSAGTTSSLFSTTTNTGASTSPFNLAPKQDANSTATPGLTSNAAPKSGMFSNLNTSNTSNASGLFGSAPTNATTPAPVGSTTPAPARTFSFNSTTPAGPPPSSNGESSKAPSGGLFGGSTQPSGGLFGATSGPGNAPSSFTQKPPATSLFNATPATTATGNPSTTTFSVAKPALATSTPQFGNLGSTTTTNPAPSSTATPITTSLFGATSKTNLPSSVAAAPASLFSGLGSGAVKTTSTTSAGATPSVLGGASTLFPSVGTSSSAQPSVTPAAGVSSTSQQPTTSTTTQPPTTGTAAPSGAPITSSATQPAGSVGASTSGPVPQISRLKNKTMDEIITRWASDLLKYQKEFQEQATKVAEWDRLLVENGDKIQKLYNSTWEAERASVEVERQLAAVESQQADLTSWLDRYENDVDEMFVRQVGQGDNLQGPDQERERTYKLAEKLTDRLDEMGKNLTSMIDAINETSSNLSKNNKTDDPVSTLILDPDSMILTIMQLSHIVRVLNSHLAQLQWIDQNAELLQQKVAAAQKLGQGLASNGIGGPESDAADHFLRSYMSRR